MKKTLLPLLTATLFLGMILSAPAQVWISLQEGDVRVGTDPATVNTSGTLLTSSYNTHCTYLRGYLSKTINFNNDTNLLMGTSDLGPTTPTSDWDLMRLLAGFDLAPVASYIGNYAYKLDAANLIITHRTVGASQASTMALVNTTAFNEANATWANPGGGAAAGGTVGSTITSKAIFGGFASYPSNQVWTAAGLVTAVQTALANSTNKTAYFMFKRGTEGDANYFGRYVTDENTDPAFGGIDSRPELQVRVTILSNAPLVSVSVTDPDLSEPGNDSATFTITRSINTTNDVSVTFSFSGAAVFGTDYTYSGPGTVVLPAGVTSTNIVVTAIDDLTPEDNENITLNISSSPDYGIGVGSATVVLADNNDGGALAQYFFGNTLDPQVWSTNVTVSTANVPGLSLSFSGVNLSPPAAFFTINTLTTTSEAGAVAAQDYISSIITSKFGYETTITNVEISAIYYNSETLEAQQAVLFLRSSVDNFTTNIAVLTNIALNLGGTWQTLSVPLDTGFANLGQIELRAYVYDDANTGDASLRIDNFYIRGEAKPLAPGKQQVAAVASSPDAAEPSTHGAFTISRAGDTSAALDVHYAVSGTATAGLDYSTLSGVVTFPAGASSVIVPVTVIDDQLAETNETVVLTVTPGASYSVYSSGTAVVTITDNPEPTQFSVVAADDNAYERVPALNAQFRIIRAGDTTGSTTASFSLGGTAVLGKDFISSETNTIAFSAGETTKAVIITPINNAAVDGNRTVDMTLQPGAGYILPSVNLAHAVIYDDDYASETVLFSDTFETTASAANYTILEGGSDGTADSLVEYAFDYGTLGVPPAPGSSTAKGLRLSANKLLPAKTAAVNLLGNTVFTNNYAVRFNLYIQWVKTNDFAEAALVGINHSGTVTNWMNFSTPSFIQGDGQYVYLNNTDRDTPAIALIYGFNSLASAPSMLTNRLRNSLTGVFNNPPYGESTGGTNGTIASEAYSATKTWVDCELKQLDGIVTFTANGTPLMSVTNNSAYTQGRIMLGYADAYDSISPAENFAIIDNVRVVRIQSVPATKPVISSIAVSGGTVTIHFNAETSDSATGFKLQSSATASGTFADDNTAIISGSGGTFQAVTAVNDTMRFYRLRRN